MGGIIIVPPTPGAPQSPVISRTRPRTKLSIDEWAQFFGIDPLVFNQVVIADSSDGICGHAWFEYAWQDVDRVSREDVGRAIREAEGQIEAYLGYRLMPTWERDERIPTIRPYRQELINLNGADIRGRFASVRAKWGQFIRGGIEARVAFELLSSVAYTDTDGDGYAETATVTLHSAAITDLCELRIFYPGQSGNPVWEIRPTAITDLGGGDVAIQFASAQAVLPELFSVYPISASIKPEPVDGMNTDNFLRTVDVYRVYNDPSQMATLMWEPVVGCTCAFSGTCEACVFAVQTACVHPRGDGRVPLVAYVPATWDANSATYSTQPLAQGRLPDVVRLWYQAGYRAPDVGCPYHEMDYDLKRTVAIFAASKLVRPICDCRNIQQAVSYWQDDLAFSGGAEQLSRWQLSKQDLENPFGTKRGAIYAWNRLTGLPEGAIGTAILT